MRGIFHLTLLAVLALSACSKSNPWSRTREDSRSNPGTLVIDVDKESLENYLSQNNKKGRIISESRNVYEVENLDSEDFKKSFPDATTSENTVFKASDPYDDVSVVISKEEALQRSREQLKRLGLDEAHKITRGKGVVVAVIDTGIKIDRWDLADNLWINEQEIPDNGIDDDNNGYIDDIHGWNFAENHTNLLDPVPHGTMSAGVIASSLTGIAPEAKIMAIKVMDNWETITMDYIMEGLIYAMDKKADLINLSLGALGPLSDGNIKMIKKVTESKIFVTLASGNFALDCSEYPIGEAMSKIPHVINVAAIDLNDGEPRMSRYSNYGSCVDIAAPSGAGRGEIGVYQKGLVTAHPYSQDKFFLYFGTSAAAPVVTGVAALVKSIHPDWTPEQIKAHLIRTATPTESLQGKVSSSAVINAYEAVK